MSIFSAIDAEHDLKIIKQAIEIAKEKIQKPDRSYSVDEVRTLLDEVQTYCEERISE